MMHHRHFKKLLQLYFYEELEQNEKTDFEKHLQSCSGCRKELDELAKLSVVLEKYKPMHADENLLNEARMELNRNIVYKEPTISPLGRLLEFIGNSFRGYRVIIAGTALIAVGFFAGYLYTLSIKYELQSKSIPADNAAYFGEPLSSVPFISNVRFLDSDDNVREIEFTFDAVMPVHMKGRVDDPNIQKVLVHALTSDLNPGVRLQSVSALTSDPETPRLENELLDALISAVRYDKNPGVRQAAIEALQQYRMEPKVRQGLLDVLVHDESAGLRIAAINLLTKHNGGDIRSDSVFIHILKTKLKNDTNNYIRMRSHAVLKEMKP